MARRLRSGARLVLASHNPGKLSELEELMGPLGVEVASAATLSLPEPAEDAPNFIGNARIKALSAAQATGLPALADDSGFCVAALDGQPGVHSARWAGPGKDFRPAMARVNTLLGEASNRRAWFVAVLCLAWPDRETASFMGRVDGRVVWPPRGSKGFGYDPIFLPDRCDKTFGEMEPREKHPVSHRARAFAQFCIACAPHSQEETWAGTRARYSQRCCRTL